MCHLLIKDPQANDFSFYTMPSAENALIRWSYNPRPNPNRSHKQFRKELPKKLLIDIFWVLMMKVLSSYVTYLYKPMMCICLLANILFLRTIFVCLWVYAHVYKNVCMCACVNMSMHVCVCVCVCVCVGGGGVHVCVWVCVFVCVWGGCARVCVSVCTCVCVCVHVWVCVLVCVCICMRVYKCACMLRNPRTSFGKWMIYIL